MKIVNLEAFRAMPPGTVFSKYTPCVFGDLSIKGDTWEVDFLYQDIASAIEADGSDDLIDKLLVAEQNGTSLSFDFDCESRDGFFDKDQLFAVWSKDDVKALISRLERCLK